MPVNTFRIFIVSQTTGSTPLAAGTLCLGGAIGMYQETGQNFQVNGVARASPGIDHAAIPQPSQVVAVVAGETWHFRGWFHDLVAGQQSANLTDGISVTFQ